MTPSIDVVLESVMRPWGPLVGPHEADDHTPGDWWTAFWWSLEQTWVPRYRAHQIVEESVDSDDDRQRRSRRRW